ncbi:DUF5959 family protein [Streptomyces pseudovenezuelae]|uniref:DUF5959 family protein n=1 Tax=Streptomyces pseudovenezuelae TaxID=67350 RepID=UPI0039A40627
MCLLPEDPDDWAEALELLAEGQPVRWMDDGRTPEIRITPKGPCITPIEVLNAIELVVRDTAVSLTSVCLLVRLPDENGRILVGGEGLTGDEAPPVDEHAAACPLLVGQWAMRPLVVTEADRRWPARRR